LSGGGDGVGSSGGGSGGGTSISGGIGRSSCGGVGNSSNGCSGNDGGNGGSCCIAVSKVVVVAVAVEWHSSGSQVEYKK
jgi:hypothetical protein